MNPGGQRNQSLDPKITARYTPPYRSNLDNYSTQPTTHHPPTYIPLHQRTRSSNCICCSRGSSQR